MSSFLDNPDFSSFNPRPELNRTDADVTLLVLRNRIQYIHPVSDPFFQATTKQLPGLFYTSDSPLSTIACTEQYQLCNSRLCTHVGGLNQTYSVLQDIGVNKVQMAVFDILYEILFSMRLFNLVFILQDSLLLAGEQVFGVY
jgi:hypothetical protein